jgi:hypothetical protein
MVLVEEVPIDDDYFLTKPGISENGAYPDLDSSFAISAMSLAAC